jgi:uncharacterized protein involved in exopolysaccharide biosynthesis
MTRRTELEFKDYWSMLKRRKRLIIASLAGSLLLAFALNMLTPPVYRATARIEIHREPTRSLLTGEEIETSTSQSDNLALYTAAELITNRTLMSKVVENLRQKGIHYEEEHRSKVPLLKGGPSFSWTKRQVASETREQPATHAPE